MAEAMKQDVLRIIEGMPDDSSLDDILYELYLHSKVEAGLEDIRAGRTKSHEEVMREVAEWLQSAGR